MLLVQAPLLTHTYLQPLLHLPPPFPTLLFAIKVSSSENYISLACWSFLICCNSQGCLPLIWLLGVLPPPESFFIWLAEQVIIPLVSFPREIISSLNSSYLVISNNSFFSVVSLWLWWSSGSLHSPTPSQPPSFPDPCPSPSLCSNLPKPYHCPGRTGWLHSLHQSPESALLLQVISTFSVLNFKNPLCQVFVCGVM